VILSAPDELAARVAGAVPLDSRPLIAIDHDGTLSPIAPRPEDAVLADGAVELLARLTALAQVAIVSGRGLADLTARFEGTSVTLVSEHGLRCRLPDGTVEQLAEPLDPEVLDPVRSRLRVLLAHAEGWHLEDKGVALAVHHRLVPRAALRPLLDTVRGVLDAAAGSTGASGTGTSATSPAGPPTGHVQVGKSVIELRPVGADKGEALRWLAARSHARPILMIGDDATDESALLAAEELGGFGILVAASARPTAASARLACPAEVITFLGRLADRLERRVPA
jgi:trehalose 6-phosphate phosphatase